jgi:hypothetical protein
MQGAVDLSQHRKGWQDLEKAGDLAGLNIFAPGVNRRPGSPEQFGCIDKPSLS